MHSSGLPLVQKGATYNSMPPPPTLFRPQPREGEGAFDNQFMCSPEDWRLCGADRPQTLSRPDQTDRALLRALCSIGQEQVGSAETAGRTGIGTSVRRTASCSGRHHLGLESSAPGTRKCILLFCFPSKRAFDL